MQHNHWSIIENIYIVQWAQPVVQFLMNVSHEPILFSEF